VPLLIHESEKRTQASEGGGKTKLESRQNLPSTKTGLDLGALGASGLWSREHLEDGMALWEEKVEEGGGGA